MERFVVPAGTKIPFALVNSLSTKHSGEGDRVYLRTTFPVVIDGRIIIPRGSYVAGTVTEVKRLLEREWCDHSNPLSVPQILTSRPISRNVAALAASARLAPSASGA